MKYKIKFVFLCLILTGVTSLSAQQNSEKPIVLILPFTANNVSEAELNVFEDHLSACVQEVGDYRVIDRRQRTSLLSGFGISVENCSDDACQMELGKLLSADMMITGSIGNITERYIITLKLVHVETGETLATKSDRYPSLKVLIDKTRQFAADFLGAGDSISNSVITEEELSSEIRYKRLLKRVSGKRFFKWAEQHGFSENLEIDPYRKKLNILKEYISEKLPSGLVLQYGLNGGYFDTDFSDTAFYRNILIPIDDDVPYSLDTPVSLLGHQVGGNLGGSLGLMFRIPYSIGIGGGANLSWLWGDYESGYYLDGELLLFPADEFYTVNPDSGSFSTIFISAFVFTDIPIFYDSTGLILGLGISGIHDFGDIALPCIGLRIGNVTFRYSYGLGNVSGYHQAEILISSRIVGIE